MLAKGTVSSTLEGIAQRLVRSALFARGYGVKRLSKDERRFMMTSYDGNGYLPENAVQELRLDHPRLRQLREDYRALDLPVCRHTVWDDDRLKADLTLPWFRGDNAYVWQFRQMRSEVRIKQYLALKHVESRDRLGLLARLEEDGAFGCWTFQYGNRPQVSRDLIESINEINFLDRHLDISGQRDFKMLDIGAGYGRLAYRMCSALDNVVRYDCVDAVAESTFLCEYYLKFRGVDDRASAIPLNELSRLAAPGEYDLAVNIHSFSECTLEAVRWWMRKLSELAVKYLLIVPNDPEELLTSEADRSKKDFSAAVEEAGYELIVKAPVYDDEELLDLLRVYDHFFLYRLRDA
ncbi:MAG: putative sugar O-methyltransferase [Gammaproteobacteria bacterium]|nr:putative sugar O-methyltransferase [Gammaproteobacteria bacterium]